MDYYGGLKDYLYKYLYSGKTGYLKVPGIFQSLIPTSIREFPDSGINQWVLHGMGHHDRPEASFLLFAQPPPFIAIVVAQVSHFLWISKICGDISPWVDVRKTDQFDPDLHPDNRRVLVVLLERLKLCYSDEDSAMVPVGASGEICLPCWHLAPSAFPGRMLSLLKALVRRQNEQLNLKRLAEIRDEVCLPFFSVSIFLFHRILISYYFYLPASLYFIFGELNLSSSGCRSDS